MIRLEMAGAQTRLHSTLCAQCPHGATGCCASPPGVDWSDIGRIVALGGGEWLLEAMERGDLRPGPRGLLLRRVASQEANAGVWPTKCVFHGPQGCTIPPERRAATCNYYICEDAFAVGGEAEGDAAAVGAREALATLTALYGRWDLELMAKVAGRWPGGPPWDAAFLDWLGNHFRHLALKAADELRTLETGGEPLA